LNNGHFHFFSQNFSINKTGWLACEPGVSSFLFLLVFLDFGIFLVFLVFFYNISEAKGDVGPLTHVNS